MPRKKYPEAIEHYPKTMQTFIKSIYNRIEGGRNALIVTIGETGSGKSLSSMSLMIGLYLYRFGKMPTIDLIVNEHCLFKAVDFMKAMNNPDLKLKEDWLWDEAGIDIGHKDHASTHNKVIGWLAQTFRNLQQVVFFTVPSMSFIDASVRKLLHYQLETRSINKKNKIATIKPLEIQYNNRQDKIYYHNITTRGSDGYIDELDTMGVPIPPKEFVDLYEARKRTFTSELNKKIQIMLEEKDIGTSYMKPEHKRLAKLLVEGKLSGKEQAKELDVSESAISNMKKRIFTRYPDILENSEKYLGNLSNTSNSLTINTKQLNSHRQHRDIPQKDKEVNNNGIQSTEDTKD